MRIASLLLVALAVSIAAVAYLNHGHVPPKTTLEYIGYALLSLGAGSSLWNWGHPASHPQAPYNQPTGQIARKHPEHQNRAA